MHSPSEFHPFRDGLAAARKNVVPGLVLQSILLFIVLAYFFWPGSRPIFEALSTLKTQTGFFYSAIATALFGGVIPFLYLKLSKANRALTPWSVLPFYLIFWAYKGMELDVLYSFEATLMGNSSAISTVISKVLFDQFIYNTLWAAPVQTLAYHFMNSRYSKTAFRGFDWQRFFLARVPTILISTWAVWIPLVTLIYCLPLALQLPAAQLATCFWVLLSSILLRPQSPDPSPK